MTVSWHGAGYVIPNRTLCFGAALSFCFFAFLYSLWIIDWSVRATAWHFALSLLCLGLYSASSIAFDRSTDQPMPPSLFLVFAVTVTPLVFLIIQSWYFIDGSRRLLSWLIRS